MVILPFLITVITGMVVLLWDVLFLGRDRKGPLIGISLVGLILGVLACAHM